MIVDDVVLLEDALAALLAMPYNSLEDAEPLPVICMLENLLVVHSGGDAVPCHPGPMHGGPFGRPPPPHGGPGGPDAPDHPRPAPPMQ